MESKTWPGAGGSPKLLDCVAAKIHLLHYSIRTEQALIVVNQKLITYFEQKIQATLALGRNHSHCKGREISNTASKRGRTIILANLRMPAIFHYTGATLCLAPQTVDI